MYISQAFWTDSKINFSRVYLHNAQIDYHNCVAKIQSYIADNSTELYDNIHDDMTHEDRKKILINYIREYLLKYKPIVAEYVQDGQMNYAALETGLIDEITNHGILTGAMTDDSITEIRINDGATPGGIWIEKGGRSMPLTDPLTNQLIHFDSQEDVSKFINNLLKYSKVTMSTSDSLVHGITVEGYRIAASDAYATARTKASLQKSPTCVIRKFSNAKLTLKDLIRYKTISTDMAKFMALLPKIDLTAAVIGSTGSGKTITLQAILDQTPLNKRILLIQNPAEIDMTTVDEEGNIVRDVVSWEAKDLKGEIAKKASSPTYAHLMDHALRYTPHLFIFGELRNDEEFALSMKAANSGHHFYTTYHAEDAQRAINRYVSAVMSGSDNASKDLVMETVCHNIRFIITQKQLDDGTRKVIGIDEICGTQVVNGLTTPKINPIFKFIADEDGVDENGRIQGFHAQIGTVSKATQEYLLLSGATKQELEIITRPASPDNMIIGDYNI